MKRIEYLAAVKSCKINDKSVGKVEEIYGSKLPDIVKRIISFSPDSVFFDDGFRSLALNEITDADSDLHVDFSKKHIIPLFDCGENDFIIYNLAAENWAKFNINEEITFKIKSTLDELL